MAVQWPRVADGVNELVLVAQDLVTLVEDVARVFGDPALDVREGVYISVPIARAQHAARHQLEGEKMLRLAKQDPARLSAILEETADALECTWIDSRVATERQMEDTAIGKAAYALTEQVEHLSVQWLEDNDTDKVFPIRTCRRRYRNDDLRSNELAVIR